MSGVFKICDEPHWSEVLKVYDRNTFKMYDAQESPNVRGGAVFKICYEPESQSHMGLSCLQVIIVCVLFYCLLLIVYWILELISKP